MASISKEGKVVFYFNKKNHKTRVLKNQTVQNEVKQLIERLLEYKKADIEPVDLLPKVKKLDEALLQQLETLGLIPALPRKHTLTDLVDAVKEKNEKNSRSTQKNMAYFCRALVEFFGANRDLSTITPEEGQRFAFWMGTRNSNSTKNACVSRCKGVFQYAVELGWISASPFRFLKGGQQNNPSNKRYITEEEVQKVLSSCKNPELKVRIALYRYTGTRGQSEWQYLTWADIDFDRHFLRLSYGKTKKYHANTDGATYRLVPMPQVLEDVLVEYLKSKGTVKPTDAVLPRHHDNKDVKAAFKAVGVDIIRPYNLRMSATQDMLDAGLSAAEYSRMADHSLQTAATHYQTAREDLTAVKKVREAWASKEELKHEYESREQNKRRKYLELVRSRSNSNIVKRLKGMNWGMDSLNSFYHELAETFKEVAKMEEKQPEGDADPETYGPQRFFGKKTLGVEKRRAGSAEMAFTKWARVRTAGQAVRHGGPPVTRGAEVGNAKAVPEHFH